MNFNTKLVTGLLSHLGEGRKKKLVFQGGPNHSSTPAVPEQMHLCSGTALIERGTNMYRNYFASRSAPKVDRASAAQILACFRDEKDLLFRLAWLITGNEATAEQSVIAGRETALHGSVPFRGWLLEWAKWVTIKAALSMNRDAICHCEPAYDHLNCTHAAHLLSQSVALSGSKKDLLVHINPRVIFTELDPLARAVLILRTAVNASIFDCVGRLHVSHEAVLAANCRAITWLHEVQLGPMPKVPSVCAEAVATRGIG